jgi:glycosyltransferase involved in cell wall biosynthesis
MLSISRVEDNKRIDWILHSLAVLENSESPLSKRVDWSLDIVGKGSKMEPLRQIAATLGIGHRIHFHGFVEDAKLVEIFAQCHLFLMPARQGYVIPAIESLQRGIPVLLHRESGVSDILLDTPWATVIHGGEDSMTPGLQTAIESVLAMRHAATPLPSLPTEASWAERVATLCNWI